MENPNESFDKLEGFPMGRGWRLIIYVFIYLIHVTYKEGCGGWVKKKTTYLHLISLDLMIDLSIVKNCEYLFTAFWRPKYYVT